MRDVPIIPMGDEPGGSDAAGGAVSRWPWQTGEGLSSVGTGGLSTFSARWADSAEAFLTRAGFDRAPWLAVLFAGGITAWFALPGPWHWCLALAACGAMALGAIALWPPGGSADETRANLRRAVIACAVVFAAGIAVIWARSAVVGAEPIARPVVEWLHGEVLEREDQPADRRLRLTLAVRLAEDRSAPAMARKIRVNVPFAALGKAGVPQGLAEGAVVRLRARLMPPASPMLPGAYDFARAAWFKGLAATGTIIGPLEVLRPAPKAGGIATIQRALSAHVRSRVEGSAGTIAAAFASGDRGSIAALDEAAMRDSGLTHLLSISGLHVSAVIAAAYFAAIRLLALWPALALRTRLPVVAAGVGALAGIGYTRGGRDWVILVGRNRVQVEERALAAACARADIVIAERYLPRSCRPRWLKADRQMLAQSGGLAIDLTGPSISRVADGQGQHGWWQAVQEEPPRQDQKAPKEGSKQGLAGVKRGPNQP